ncbi:SDR family NAD(P)-dependent oxidoreductase [Novosphingobium aquimarinum]|uniref:SDR family NAD(P)-dependent oxidoreductase n=1 Tax=Novosphingobium aquimarinum TaxID=2682494 RepID=UPI0012EBC67C|nr:glucose 1-dehydrogenase [Novosphingobium aquimarinum]
MGRLTDKVAIITGGARGMGAATSRLFAQEGATVMVADVLEDEGRALAQDLGGNARFVRLDVSNEADWVSLVKDTVAEFGRIDALVANAGVLSFGELVFAEADEFDRVYGINVKGVFFGIKHVGGAMRSAGRGAIVNIASIDGFRGANALGLYSSSKWAVRGMTKTAALELGPHGVRVNSVHPGGVNTPMVNGGDRSIEELNYAHRRVPLQRIGAPEEIAAASLFLCSDEASYISAAELGVDGGWAAGYYHDNLPGAPASLTGE